MFDYQTFSNTVRSLRKKTNLTEYLLGVYSDINISTMSKIETNELKPTLKAVINLANYFGLSISDFFSDKDDLERQFYISHIATDIEELENCDIEFLAFTLQTLLRLKRQNHGV